MCSISGFYDPAADFTARKEYYQHILDKMKTALKHRGPDDNGSILTPCCGLAHTRLSIIDPAGGHQPMSRKVDGYSYHIIYNGEIYNLPMLRKRLEEKNVTPETNSDTEILLLGFLTFGADFVTMLDGIFSFAIYDERHRICTLYRDSFGVKPLFYTIENGTLIFSSEPKGCFCFPGVEAVLDREGINEIFALGPARTPGSGVFKNFHELLPGTYMTCTPHGRSTTTYFHLESRPHSDSYKETVEKTSFLIQDAIRRQMVSDVPICTFLSGGLDSSVVSAVCAGVLKNKGETLTTFSFDFKENTKYFKANSFQPSEDRPYVERMVEFLHADHHYLECSNTTQADLLLRSVDAHDLPCMADIDSSLQYFCKEVSRSHKVVLTGECADEVFGGYPWFHREDMLNSGTFPWTPSLKPREDLLSPEIAKVLNMDEYVRQSYDTAVSEIHVLPGENEIETSRRRIGYLNIRYFMQTLLNRMDRTSMYSGLEARVPFADRTLVEYVFNIPWEMKAKNGIVKNILRHASEGLLPDEILYRKKSPYPKTYNPYYETLLANRLREALLDGKSPLSGLLNLDSLKQFMDNPKDYGAPWYGQLMAGPQMLAYLLQIDYFLRRYNVRILL